MNPIALLILFPLALSAVSVKEKMKTELDVIENFFEIQYAPLEWKQKHLDWNLSAEIARSKNKIDQKTSVSNKDFQLIVRDFFKSLHDYHTTVHFYPEGSASLPFSIKGADNKYFVSHLDPQFPQKLYPWKVGDEVVTFHGKPTHEAILDVQFQEFGTQSEGTDRSLAEFFLTKRTGSLGHEVPEGFIKIGIKSKSTKKITTYQVEWRAVHDRSQAIDSTGLQKMLITPLHGVLTDDAHNSFIPCLGEKVWETAAFDAYLFCKDDGKKIGYVRISDYQGGTQDAWEFAEILNFFEIQTEALVIDQVNNPGGSLFYMMALSSMFGQSLILPQERIAISQDDVATASYMIPLLESVESDEDAQKLLGEDLSGYPVTYALVQSFLIHFRYILETWNSHQYITEPFYLYGIDHIDPHPRSSYSKPILLLVNELSFSCADFFPSILQDNGRATIMGTQTAGAGGFVMQTSFSNRFGIAGYSYTGSIIERGDQKPLENLGVIPDIVYKPTQDDLQDDYVNYRQAILNALDNL